MTISKTAMETLGVIERGAYSTPSNTEVSIRAAADAATAGTITYRPDELDDLLRTLPVRGSSPTRIELTGETTLEAGRRLVETEGESRVVALNFASAKNPGGGFLGGAKAQEEDLARCSALYPCLVRQNTYYEANRAESTLLYTDYMIYSPDIPFFRDDHLRFLERPFLLSMITAPAPNAGAALDRNPQLSEERIRETFDTRIPKVLAVAAAKGHRTLVLGAWGCGAFRNDPNVVAAAFHRALSHERFRGMFDRVVFAVYDPKGRNRPAFERYFGNTTNLDCNS